ncbi:MAG TPA: hypothetical protein VF692_15325, partial [Pyrinomonadaceae bacterium]
PRNLPIGARGTATVSLRIMGRGLHFKINVGVNHDAVAEARRITDRFLNIGLEGAEAQPIPGSTPSGFNSIASPAASTNGAAKPSDVLPLAAGLPLDISPVVTADKQMQPESIAEAHDFVAPHYSIYCIPTDENESYFLLYPNEIQPGTELKQGFLPVPPANRADVENDFEWTFPALGGAAGIEHYDPLTDVWKNIDLTKPHKWKADWEEVMGDFVPEKAAPDKNADNKIRLKDLLRKAYIPQPGAQGFYDVIPGDDPKAIGTNGTFEDARVYNPSDAAFEAAVRGAAEQFEGSPYFKRDENSFYEANLANAFSPETTIYSDDGLNTEDAENSEQAHHLRSTIVAQMLTDLQKYIEKEPNFNAVKSVAFQMGLVFRTKDGIPNWLKDNISAGKLKQRTKIGANAPDNGTEIERDVKIFNTALTNFIDCVPQFQRVRQYTDVNTIAITWDLFWTEETQNLKLTGLSAAQKDPEQFLNHYLIRRRALSGGEREIEIKVKPVDVLTLPSIKAEKVEVDTENKRIFCKTGGFQIFERGKEIKIKVSDDSKAQPITAKIADSPQAVQPKQLIFEGNISALGSGEKTLIITGENRCSLRSRFQFTDNFNDETLEDQAELSREGKSYLYTIIPVDVTGKHSRRPLTILATRRANFPPSVPADGELKIDYKLKFDKDHSGADNDFEPVAEPIVLPPAKIVLVWTKPPDVRNQPRVVIKNYRLIFRKEKTLPIGSYALDAESEGNRNEGLPSGNARALRTDVVVELEADRANNFSIELNLQDDLIKNGIFPKDRQWRPEAWRVFLQTESESGVLSQLVPLKLVLRFEPNTPTPNVEIKPAERQPSLLEWISR